MIARSLEILDWMVVIGDDLPTSQKAVELAGDRIYASVGIHPYYADTLNTEMVDALRFLAQSENVVALGEMGLDYFKHCDIPKEVQKEAFRAQLDLACEMNLPVVIHNRESTEDLCKIIDDYTDNLCGGVLHCFAGSPEFVKHCLSWGFHVSFAGNVTFPKAEELRIAAKEVPLDRLLVETDAPYLAPQAVRGKRCEPGYTKHTAEFLADFYGISYEELSKATADNAARLYRVNQD